MTFLNGCCIMFKVIEMEKIVKQTLLYDFYGELLNEHQKSIYEDSVLNDCSLSEIAESNGVSRQAVHDILKRCNSILEEYESKLHLIEKFEQTKQAVHQIHCLTGEYMESRDLTCIEEIELICNNLLENF